MGGGTRREKEEGREGRGESREGEPFPPDLNLMQLARLMLWRWFATTFRYTLHADIRESRFVTVKKLRS